MAVYLVNTLDGLALGNVIMVVIFCLFIYLFLARQPPSGSGPPHSRGF